MAGLMDNLAAGLRLAGGTVSPGVFQQIGRENEIQKRFAQALQLQQMEQMRQDEREAALARAVGPHLQAGNFEGAAAAAAGTPGGLNIGMQMYGKAEDRAAKLQQARDALVARHQEAEVAHQRHIQVLMVNKASREEIAAANREHQERMKEFDVAAREHLVRLSASLRPPPATEPLVEISDPSSPTGRRMLPRSQASGLPSPGPASSAGGMTPEAAAKTELLVNGMKDVQRFRELVMPSDKPNRTIIAGMALPGTAGVPGTDSRLAYSYIYNAIEAKLRAESGAAVPETEVKRMAKRFVPSPLDNDETIKSKVDRLEEFLSGSLSRVKGAGAVPSAVPATPAVPANNDPLGIR